MGVLHPTTLLCRSLLRLRLVLTKSSHSPTFSTLSESASVNADRPVLVRDFIHDALYHPHHGYFSAKSEAVGMLPEPILFNHFTGRRHYMQYLDELYKQHDISWFTPAELFKIFEIGGGTGTCAKNILDYLKDEAPSIYHNMQYVSVEISKALANIQLKSVHAGETHKSRYFVEHRDACKRLGWGQVDERPCFVMMLEVLDNQPHDLIYKENSSFPWLETHIMKGPDNAELAEGYQAVEDPLIQRCIEIMEYGKQSLPSWLLSVKNVFHRAFPFKRKAWIPTASLQLLEVLYSVRPNLALIVSDFHVLPDVRVQGERAPVVATKKDGVTVDLESYLDAKGDADIFFPTDFQLLQKLDCYCYNTTRTHSGESKSSNGKGHCLSYIVPVSQFMKQFADMSRTSTKDGFNPLLDDYSNMQFYLTRLL